MFVFCLISQLSEKCFYVINDLWSRRLGVTTGRCMTHMKAWVHLPLLSLNLKRLNFVWWMKAIKKLLFNETPNHQLQLIKTILVTQTWLTSSSIWAFWLFTVCLTEYKDFWNMLWLLCSCLVFNFHCSPPNLNFPAKLVYHSNQIWHTPTLQQWCTCYYQLLRCAQYEKSVSKFFGRTFLHSLEWKSFRHSRDRHYIKNCIILF